MSIMPKDNVIDCNAEGPTVAFPFAPAMFIEASAPSNMSVFEVRQMGLEKEVPCLSELLTLWWGDLKTEVQMLSMQTHGDGMRCPFDWYQHIMPGLALWHLRFNHLKMIWEVLGTATERSALQSAADHWHRDETIRPSNYHLFEDLPSIVIELEL